MQLDKKVQNEVDELVDIAYEEFENKNFEKSFQALFDAWDKIPEPKVEYFESFNIARYIYEDYMKIEKYEKASEWLENIKRVRAAHPDTWIGGEVEFLEGKLFFETGQLEAAKEKFKVAMSESEGRVFEGEPKKYLDLLKKK